jgi:nuclear transport factor 2 (NTF2) superfamily protein
MLLKYVKPLRELVFSFKWGSRHLPIPRESDQRQRLVEDLFSWCQNLLCVDIAYEWTTITEIWYQRWTRETVQSSPIMVSMMEVKCGRFGGR